MTSVQRVQEALRGCFEPEYQAWAEMFDEQVQRNPVGWLYWIAMKQDERSTGSAA